VTSDVSWIKSSYSGSEGNCVETASATGRVLVRDTQDRTGPVLKVTASAWRELVTRVKDR
jgi:hypothetical protein